MATWDVFHADRLELERGLTHEGIRAALARGSLVDDDLVRPAGTAVAWVRLAELPELAAPLPDLEKSQRNVDDDLAAGAEARKNKVVDNSTSSDVTFPVMEPEPRHPPQSPFDLKHSQPAGTGWTWEEDDRDDESDDEDLEILADEQDLDDLAAPPPRMSQSGRPATPQPHPAEAAQVTPRWELGEDDLDLDTADQGARDNRLAENSSSSNSRVALPVVPSRDRDSGLAGGDDGVEPEANFSLSRSATQTIEELDLAPMVDVAFQLVLFFMVTATTILYKTLEIPKPAAEPPPGAVAQGRNRSLDDLKDDFIIVEIDPGGAMKLDREPIEASIDNLVERLRTAREKTGRKTMLLSAEFSTPHRNSVLAYDAANEIGLGIAIAKPQAPQTPAPTLRGSVAPVSPRPALAPGRSPS